MSAARATYRVVHRDDVVLVVDKAPGVLTVAAPGRPERALLDELRRDGLAVAPIHRLDRETSGLLLFCIDPAHRGALEQAFRRRRVLKEYLALCHGVPRPARATIDVPIRDRGATAAVDPRGARAVTHYEVERALGRLAARLRLRIETGRHNQIRVHLAHVGHPVVGDRKYGRRGPRALPARRALLHAARLRLEHPATGRPLDLRAAPPDDMAGLEAELARAEVLQPGARRGRRGGR